LTAQCAKADAVLEPGKIFLTKVHQDKVDNTSVLDLYAGENVMWSHFKTDRYYGIEIIKGKGKNLNADCKRVIGSLDLSSFNVIDCDSYGIPFDVMLKLFANPTLQKGTAIVYAAISNRFSGVSKECLKMYGLEEMYKKAKC